MLLRQLVRLLRAQALDDTDVLKMASRHGLKSMDYEKVARGNLSRILDRPISGVLLFFTDHSKPNKPIGHFCLLYKTPQTGIVFFDPLGNSLHKILKMTENKRGLLRKLAGVPYTENKIQYQRQSEDVQTCGRHCVCRYNAAVLSSNEYRGLMHLPGLTPDDIVTILTLEDQLPKLLAHYKKRKK